MAGLRGRDGLRGLQGIQGDKGEKGQDAPLPLKGAKGLPGKFSFTKNVENLSYNCCIFIGLPGIKGDKG